MTKILYLNCLKLFLIKLIFFIKHNLLVWFASMFGWKMSLWTQNLLSETGFTSFFKDFSYCSSHCKLKMGGHARIIDGKFKFLHIWVSYMYIQSGMLGFWDTRNVLQKERPYCGRWYQTLVNLLLQMEIEELFKNEKEVGPCSLTFL